MRDELKAAVLDVDGSLYPGALGVELLRALRAEGACDLQEAQGVFEVLGRYKQGHIDFKTMASEAYGRYALSLQGVQVERVEEVASRVWEQERQRLFSFARPLVATLREAGYWLVLISGSPQEMVRRMAEELGISHAQGALFGQREGRYTGEVALPSASLGEKARIFQELAGGRSVCLERCFAMGDSLTDAALFEQVGLPLAFEPDPALAALARERGWAVATREDVLECTRSLLAAPGRSPS
jgi:HAD superfamily hydrolase (TIGR01490 family)